MTCPDARESGAGKVTHEAYLRAHSEQTQVVAIKLRRLPWANPACADVEGSSSCSDRDGALTERQALNLKQVECVLAAFGPPGSIEAVRAQWYEPLQTPSSGPPTPIGTAFSVLALWSQLEAVARHPYVERIEPAPRQASKLGVPAPAPQAECPVATDPLDPKLADAASIRGNGRLPVVVELKHALLPALRPCEGEKPCDDWLASGWERTVASTRQLTCVQTFIDTKLQADSPEVAYRSVDGIPQGPKLPPFGESIHATLAFGLGLTWEEASEVAKHPFVGRLWSSEGLSLGVLPEGCPPDYDAPVPVPECTSETQAVKGKFSAAAEAQWQASTMPNEVVIAVRRGKDLCPLPACPGRATACPELERYTARLDEESKASQTCVRSLVASIGGSASDEAFTLGNAFPATLTWQQIQTVAAHPDVQHIDPRYGDAPP
ncbi:MAG TPA: hypothetical protein VJN18_21585 [Polyangiaceae bacterium]|nr:hypothetical protein [Polyangiaceae bacterium]